MKSSHRILVYLLTFFLSLTTAFLSPGPIHAQKKKKEREVSITVEPVQKQDEDGKEKKSKKSSSASGSIQNQGGQGDARAALDRGKALLRQNQADQAIGYLETALRLFDQSGNGSGRAAAEDAIGDIYARQGQYNIALRYYQSAHETFQARKESTNSNLMLAKIGETYFRLGEVSKAQLAFAQMTTEKERKSSASGLLGASGGAAGAVSGAASSAVAGSASQGASAGQNSVLSQVTSSLNSATTLCPFNNPNVPNTPNQGVAAKRPDDIGRVDLRVFDQNGNPVHAAKAKIESIRPNNLLCSNEGLTDLAGRLLFAPLHMGKVTLDVKARGFDPLKMALAPESFGQPLRVVLQGKNAAPVQSATSSLNSCADIYRQFFTQTTSLLGQGRAALMSNQLSNAQQNFHDALNSSGSGLAFGSLGHSRKVRAAARTSLGDIAFLQGRYADALKLYQEAIDGARQDGRLDLIWAAQRGIGKTYWTLSLAEKDAGQAAKMRLDAINSYREALKTIETIRAGSLRADEARTTFVATTKDVFDEASGILAEMALIESPKPGPLGGRGWTLASESLTIVEQGRARALLDLMDESRIEITEGIPPELSKRRAEILARQEELAEKLTGVALAGEAPSQTIQDLEAELDRLLVDYDLTDNFIRAASPRYASLTSTKPLSLAEIQRQLLDDRTALLVYSLGRERSYLYATTRATLSLYRLPARAVVEQQAMDLRAKLIPGSMRRQIAGIDRPANSVQRGLQVKTSTASKEVNDYATAAHAIYRMVLEPAATLIGDKRLVIISDGALNYVPFEAFVKSHGGADFASLHYLIKTNEVVYAPSASVVASSRQQAAGKTGQGILIVADPVFDAGDPRAGGAGSGVTGGVLRDLAIKSAVEDIAKTSLPNRPSANWGIIRLEGTRAEADRVSQLTRSAGGRADVWLDLEASETNIKKRDISSYRFLHFATHGFLNAERPQFSGLVLSLVGEKEGDGFLRAQEVFNLRLGSPFVMLSACETGLGKERRGEGVIGLTRAFIYAGAPTVGVSLWSVDDESTAELMADTYKGLLAGQTTSPATALRAAQQKMIAGKTHSEPFFWAPFVLVGDWR